MIEYEQQRNYTEEEKHIIRECVRVWLCTARSAQPWIKHSEPEYGAWFDCPVCKWHGYSSTTVGGYCANDCDTGGCLLTPVWGSSVGAACENSPVSPYNRWSDVLWYYDRQSRHAAWGMVRSIEQLLHPWH